jgi:hypothetical protein
MFIFIFFLNDQIHTRPSTKPFYNELYQVLMPKILNPKICTFMFYLLYQLTKLNIEAQRIERELRSELEGVVSKYLHEAILKRQRFLEESESKLKVEVMRLKEISDVASHQAEAIQAQQESRDKELTSLRKQLYDVQMENDDKTIIGKHSE